MARRITRTRRLFGVLLAVALLLVAAPAWAQVEVQLDIDPDTVNVGETFTVQVTVSGTGLRSVEPELPDSPYFRRLGRSSTSQSISIVNGQTSVTREYGYQFQAVKEGAVQVGPATVGFEGKTHRSRVGRVTILGGNATPIPRSVPDSPPDESQRGGNRFGFVEARVESDAVYPGQEVPVAYYFYGAPGTRLREIRERPDFSGAIAQEVFTIKTPDYSRVNVDGQPYVVTPLARYVLYPVAPGEMTVGSFELGAVSQDHGRRRNLFDDFFGPGLGGGTERIITGKPQTITVKPLPTQGRPANFSGNVGVYKLEAGLDKPRVAAGEAVTLTLGVEGKGNVQALTAPEFKMPDAFKAFSEASRDESVPVHDTIKSRRVFETILVPQKQGKYRLGPFTLPVFNPEKGEYETVSAPAMDLTVTPGTAEATATPTRKSRAIELAGQDIRTIKRDASSLDAISAPATRTGWFWLMLLIGPIAFAAQVWRVRRAEHLQHNVALARKIKAGKEAKKRLAEAQKAESGAANEFGAQLASATMGFVADQLNVSAPSLTAASARDGLASRGITEAMLDEFAELLRSFDAMRFGGLSPSLEQRRALLEKTGQWIETVHRQLAKGGR